MYIVHSTGIGPKRAIDLIKQYKTIEEIVKHIDTKVIQYTCLFRVDTLLIQAGLLPCVARYLMDYIKCSKNIMI